MKSAKVADPLKLFEVCPMTDAGSALVLCREEILRDQPDKPQVYVTASQMATGTWYAATDTPRRRLPALQPSPPRGPTRWPGSPPTTSTSPRSTTRSPSRSRSGSRASASLLRARAGRARPTVRPGSTARSRSTCRAVCCARATRSGATGATQAVDIIEQLRGTAPEGIQAQDPEIGITACRGGPGAVGRHPHLPAPRRRVSGDRLRDRVLAARSPEAASLRDALHASARSSARGGSSSTATSAATTSSPRSSSTAAAR